MKRLTLLLCAGLLLAVGISCSGGGSISPVIPGLPSEEMIQEGNITEPGNGGNGHNLWGYWQCTYDPSTKQLEAVPLRGLMFHANAAKLISDPNPPRMVIKVNSFDNLNGVVDVDVSLIHPFPNTDYRGFDVRGIFMGPGETLVSQTDPGIVFPSINAARLLNADGYARWWNAVEFTTPGLFGYNDSRVVPGFLVPETTINAYKYFADPLSASDPVVPKVDLSNRGTFSTDLPGNRLTRNYQVKFPKVEDKWFFKFHYAVDACWARPTGSSPAPKPIEDYPIRANCPEPYHIEVDSSNSVIWYESDDNYGGELNLSIEVFDWRAAQNPEGILGEIESIWIESPTLIDTTYISSLSPEPGSQATSAVFNVTIPDAHPTSVDGQELLITVRSKQHNTYAQPASGAAYPEGAMLAAYTMVEVPVLAFMPTFESLKLKSPNGGEVWAVSSQQTVTWDWAGDVPEVNIDLSIDSGLNYDHNIATGVTNTGEFNIESVPVFDTDKARILVSSTSHPDLLDESDYDFTIEPTVLVTTPNGGDLIIAGTSTVIKWIASDTITDVSILLSLDSGESYLEPIILSTPNTGDYTWEYVLPEYVGTKCRIEILDKDNPLTLDTSDADFTILPETVDPITVLAPNGGETYQYGGPVEITWGADPAIDDVSIWVSTDSGQNYTIEVNSSTTNDGNFTVPAIPEEAEGQNNRIRIADASDPAISDESDGDFTVESSITVTTPNGSELWVAGQTREITWDSSSSIGNVAIMLSKNSGQSYMQPVSLNTLNDGSFTWANIPADTVGSSNRIRIQDADNTTISDESDYDFTVLPESEAPILVTSPNGGETWGVDSNIGITWEATPTIANVKIELSLDAGGNYTQVIAEFTPNDGVFDWPIPPAAEGTTNKIKLSDVESPGVFDESNDCFTVNPPGVVYIDLLYPNGGQELMLCEYYVIAWEWSGNIPNVDILMTVNDGQSYEVVSSYYPNTGIFELNPFLEPWLYNPVIWTSTTLDARVKVVSSDNSTLYDESDADFTIPINLEILMDMINDSTDIDSDQDGLPDDIENFIGSDPLDADADKDFIFDFNEIFGGTQSGGPSYDPCDLICRNNQGVICTNTSDGNDDGENDGNLIDSDNDCIPNYLEYYGYTYDWLPGQFEMWDGIDIFAEYYKSDPLQPSTDQDPYSDSMESTGLFMDVSVDSPGDHPLVPGYPNIVVKLEGYSITLNEELTYSEGGSLSEGTEWSRESTKEHSHTEEHNWEIGVEMMFGFKTGYDGGSTYELTFHGNYGGSVSNTNTTSTTVASGGSIIEESEWNKARCVNPTDAAHMKLYLKVYNLGTSTASNIIPTMTLKIAGLNVATFEPGNTQINILTPGGVYPSGQGTYWVVDTIDTGYSTSPLSLTMSELRALERGAPVSIEVTQMAADVMVMDNYGYWESVGDWNEYMARCEAVCANIFLDVGDGNFIHYLVYADDAPSAPSMRLSDALILVAGGYESGIDQMVRYYDEDAIEHTISIDEFHFAFDAQTLGKNGWDITSSPWTPPPGDFNCGDTILGPDTVIIGKAPRDVADIGPDIHYAYYDEIYNLIKACVTDYQGIKSVQFKDKDGQYWDLTEDMSGSGFYTFLIDDGFSNGYEFGSTEKLRVTNLNDDWVEVDLGMLYIEPPPQPKLPEVKDVTFWVEDHYLSAQVIPDDSWPVQWVRAYHEGLSGGFIEMAPVSDAYEDPFGYEVDLPCSFYGIDLKVVAFIQTAVYTEKTVDTLILAYSKGGFTVNDLDAQHDWTGADSWKVPVINLDTGAVTVLYYENDGDWQEGTIPNGWDPMLMWEIWFRWDDRDSTNGGQVWRIFFNFAYTKNPVDQSKFECLSRPDCTGLALADIAAAEFAVGDVFVMKTNESRYCKFLITEREEYDPSGNNNRGLRIGFDYVTFSDPP